MKSTKRLINQLIETKEIQVEWKLLKVLQLAIG
jgi:hypothetical protein